jgi:hypothetical protein
MHTPATPTVSVRLSRLAGTAANSIAVQQCGPPDHHGGSGPTGRAAEG